jgi:hypothetical protein
MPLGNLSANGRMWPVELSRASIQQSSRLTYYAEARIDQHAWLNCAVAWMPALDARFGCAHLIARIAKPRVNDGPRHILDERLVYIAAESVPRVPTHGRRVANACKCREWEALRSLLH